MSKDNELIQQKGKIKVCSFGQPTNVRMSPNALSVGGDLLRCLLTQPIRSCLGPGKFVSNVSHTVVNKQNMYYNY